ncbi:MAG: hypothetical protein Q8P15_01150 [Nanoarchaeota archaeon]|nr:hypothetical protein [Nanoarchaeota archaeon]
MNSEIEETKGIKAMMILEIVGKPPEHLVETLENLIKNIDEEKGVSVREKKIKEPVIIKNKKTGEENKDGFYTTFAEIEVEVEEITYLAMLMFKYMPAHIEVIEPELIILSNTGWGDILSELTRRLHGYDEVARIVQAEKAILEEKLREVLSGKKKEEKEE